MAHLRNVNICVLYCECCLFLDMTLLSVLCLYITCAWENIKHLSLTFYSAEAGLIGGC